MDAGFYDWDLQNQLMAQQKTFFYGEFRRQLLLPPVAKMLYPTYKLSQSGYQGRSESSKEAGRAEQRYFPKGWEGNA